MCLPHSHENKQPLFESLYQICDLTRRGPRDILLLSELQDDLITIILDMAECNKSARLCRAQFYVAVRLIQLYQNGVPVSNLKLTVPDNIHLFLPYFKGISNIESGFYRENPVERVTQFSLHNFKGKLPKYKSSFMTRSCPSLNGTSKRPEMQKSQGDLRRSFSRLKRAVNTHKYLSFFRPVRSVKMKIMN